MPILPDSLEIFSCDLRIIVMNHPKVLWESLAGLCAGHISSFVPIPGLIAGRVRLQNRTSARAVGLSSSLSQLCNPRRLKSAGCPAKSWQQEEESSLWALLRNGEWVTNYPGGFDQWSFLFAGMLPDFRTMRRLCGRPKSGTVNLHSVVSLNLTALLLFSFDTRCTSLLSAFTLFLSLIFMVGFFFFFFCG